MFEAGSDLETLILKYNVGEKEGIRQYTIDAIKYVDGEYIKDVRMEGERTGVTSIRSEAFSGCTKLTDIVIPSTVTGMGHGVFAGCTSLKSVVLEGDVIE